MKTPKNKKTHTYPSMAAAAVGLGVTLADVRLAKRLSCPAFHISGRIDAAKLARWLDAASNQRRMARYREEQSGGIAQRKLAEQVRRLKGENDQRESGLISRAVLRAKLAIVCGRARDIVTRRLDEWARGVVNRDVAGARRYGQEILSALLADIAESGAVFDMQDASSNILDKVR